MVDNSKPLCKTGTEAMSEYLARFSKNQDVIQNDVENDNERYNHASEVLKKLFGSSGFDHFRFDPPTKNSKVSGGTVVRSLGGCMASFNIDTSEDMENTREFLKNVTGFYLAAVVDSKNPSKVLLMLDWRLEDVGE